MKLGKRWTQVGGDMNPEDHGAILARMDGDAIEIREIQPVISCVGESEGLEVGYPHWSKEAWYDPEDIKEVRADEGIRSCCDLDRFEDSELTDLIVAGAALSYGWRTHEGPSGFSSDVLPVKSSRIKWWARQGHSWRQADAEYRRMRREAGYES
jgi:hypothetical protein